MVTPAIYTGTLRHRRFRPVPHQFTYSVFMALLDIDRIPETMELSRWSSYNRFNWASFDERDHAGDASRPLRERLAADAKEQGVPLPSGPIYLLTNLRYLGYCFNPISLYFFCEGGGPEWIDGRMRAGDGALAAGIVPSADEGAAVSRLAGGAAGPVAACRVPVVLAEVHNTFGELRNYWLWAGNRTPSEHSLRFRCPKTMHVSPFMGMSLDYDFVLTPPQQKLVAHMNTLEGEDRLLDATLTLDREPWTAANLRRALVRQPWMTAKVIAAIHWEALRLLAKRVPVFTHPDAHSKKVVPRS